MIKRGFFIKWFEISGRHFPWREEGVTPYQLLVTEILLNQTKADDVAKIWIEFFNVYPNIVSLSQSNNSELVTLIKQLGFGNLRSRALQSVAVWIVEKHNGRVPDNLKELLAIPFVGDYVSRAVLCFAFDQRVEIVDTNVLRLFSRYFSLVFNSDIRRTPLAWEIAREQMPDSKRKAKAHNYGMLDFTAQICKPHKPLCEICPLQKSCAFGRKYLGVKLNA